VYLKVDYGEIVITPRKDRESVPREKERKREIEGFPFG